MLTPYSVKIIHEYIAPKKYKKLSIVNEIENIRESIDVKIKGRRTTVTLFDGTKGSVYCYIDDTLDENKGIEFAYYKAKEKQYKKKFLSEISKFEDISVNKPTTNKGTMYRGMSLPF